MSIRPEDPNDTEGVRWPFDDYLGLVRSNSARYVRNYVALGWAVGQQLWDSMVNDAFRWANIWNDTYVHFRRNIEPNQRPPWYVPGGWRQIDDPKHMTPPEGKSNTLVSISPGGVAYFGSSGNPKVYVMADRMVVMWTPLGILPVMRLPQKEQTIEIAVFASKPPKGGTMWQGTVGHAFRIHKGNRHGRVRGWPYSDGSNDIGLYKNGVKVGSCYVSQHSTGVRVDDTVDFLADDVLELRMPSSRQGRNVAISIVGEYLS